MEKIMKINHIGILVDDIDKAINKYKILGYVLDGELVNDTDRNIYIQFMKNDGYRVELICEMDKEKMSPAKSIGRQIKISNYKMYHICYEVEDLEVAIADLETKGYQVLVPRQKAIAFDNRNVVFMYEPDVGMIELVEE